MKYIRIKADIIMPNGSVLKFHDIMENAWLASNEFGKGVAALRTAVKLEALFKRYSVHSWVPVEDTDYALLKLAVETTQYVPALSKHAIPFIDAVTEAPNEEPTSPNA